MNDLRICLVQAELEWEDRTKNLSLLYGMLKNVSEVDVIVLPELFSTGFTMNAKDYAIEPNGDAVIWMKLLAKEKQSCVTGSLIIKDGEKVFNRLFWVEPDGTINTYDKKHLFSLAGEEKVFSAGNERLIVEYKGWRICPLICYDLRFPVWCRNTVDYDLLLFVANWPARRSYPWQQLLKARAIENLAYVVGVNRVGNDGNQIWHSGDSAAIDPLGKEITSIKPGKPSATVVTLHKEEVEKVRSSFSFLNDRDAFDLR